ncbi:MAG: lipoate--protein ligase family protein [Cytophagaceae bacterium]|nr:lipoate--protein ligase family protein [Gemmatimonadaceae bacterium]
MHAAFAGATTARDSRYLPAMRWAFLHTPPLPGAANMAIDEWLLARARRNGVGTVRVYSWAGPTASFGRHQSARRGFDPERARAHGIGVVRRLTGGRAVLHHREITYAIAAPITPGRDLGADYATVNTLLLSALRTIGVDARIVPEGRRLPPPGSAPCFELPAPGELVVDGRKLVGSAQYREGAAWLQHGSILVHDDQPLLRDIAIGDVPVTDAATLTAILGREVSAAEFAAVLRRAVEAAWDAALTDLAPDVVRTEAAPLEATYDDDAWTWRR